ncbi:alpha/beta-hydrolase [Aspergillus steynii IBT 23096]|uniref:Alpha/beta-hydrolase n=1 Tax=Aspergillus steynii IBT 23096 TaxID=1392250 RepID=A0A2I2G9Y0_9EURO|nr:alpha/beta-hydrolase [Aspergillus steynii IBT 23096]PLB49689.1 alpha/beta-hydrolase [Aspergillus steynii IBT 23096]
MPSPPFFDLLNALDSLNNKDKYSNFHIINTPYKTLSDDCSVAADILIPRTIRDANRSSPRPVIIRIHGGFLVTGSSLYAPWFNNWILDYALQHDAIIISPNYRLLPEVSGSEILEDIHDLWKWVGDGSVDKIIKDAGHRELGLNLDSILVVGESAGGYLATQLAISYPYQIRALIAAYPMVDLQSRFYTEAFSKPIVGVPNVPEEMIDKHLAMIAATGKSRVICTAANPPDRVELAFSIVQNGRFLEFFGTDRSLFPMVRIEDELKRNPGFQLPPMFILHGEQDSAVPVDGSRKFVQFLQKNMPDTQVILHTEDGDHGFDALATLDMPWLKSALAMISKEWLGSYNSHL